MSVTVTKSGEGMETLKKALERVASLDVLIGIPQEKTARKETTGVTNASLLFLHTNGSPLQNIPARPVIEPAIAAEGNKEKIAAELKKAAELVFQNKPKQAEAQLRVVGMLGQDIARDWFVDPRNGWPPNSPKTIARKLKRLSAKQIAKKQASGEPLDRPLIDTGQLIKSIIYVVREGKND